MCSCHLQRCYVLATWTTTSVLLPPFSVKVVIDSSSSCTGIDLPPTTLLNFQIVALKFTTNLTLFLLYLCAKSTMGIYQNYKIQGLPQYKLNLQYFVLTSLVCHSLLILCTIASVSQLTLLPCSYTSQMDVDVMFCSTKLYPTSVLCC